MSSTVSRASIEEAGRRPSRRVASSERGSTLPAVGLGRYCGQKSTSRSLPAGFASSLQVVFQAMARNLER